MQAPDVITIVLQSIIAVFLIWYAIETYKLRKQTTYQNKISIQPIIDFVGDLKLPPRVFTLENVGFGAALNIHLYVWLSEKSKFLALSEFHRPSILKPTHKYTTPPLEVIDSSSITKNHPQLAKLINTMPSLMGPTTMLAVYQDAAGNSYYTQQYSHPSLGKPFTFGPL